MLLVDFSPLIAAQWDHTKNAPLRLETVTKSSGRLAWWSCEKDHSWRAKVCNRTLNNSGCPYCSGRFAIPGETDLGTMHPNLVLEWSDKNNSDIRTIKPSSNVKFMWTCEKGHEWSATPYTRIKGHGCPVCSGRQVHEGVGSISDTHRHLVDQWAEKNTIKPNEVSAGSGKKIYWIGPCGHEWSARVYKRTQGQGCPVCAGKTVVEGYNDVSSKFPHILGYWSDRNNRRPTEISPHSGYKLMLKCLKGHEWATPVYNAVKTEECPVCALSGTSRTEQKLFNHIKEKHPNARNRETLQIDFLSSKSLRADIYLDLGKTITIMEYDGAFYHKDLIDRDTEKTKALLNADYRVVRVREQTVGIKLPLLDINHPNLLQLSYSFHKQYEGLDEIVTKIVEFISAE